VPDIRDWLEKLGLAHHWNTFFNNDVDLAALPHLTEAMLKEMGLSIGVRAKVMAGIDALKTEQSAAAAASRETWPPVVEQPGERFGAERRHLTVMFCDLVGSTALSERLDPEDLRAVIGSYHAAAARVIEHYRGHVAQYLGDGILAYFGWPTAHEDDVERALRAGLDIVQQARTVAAPVPIQVRIGVATGLVVVGEGGGSAPNIAVGETPNLAARLQGLAGVDEIVIDPATGRFASKSFELTDLGSHTLKGFADPVRAARVGGLARTESRFDAHVGSPFPFVGRDPEIRMLLDRWESAKDGEGQVVLLEGEPGLGKSRLVQEFCERIRAEPHTQLHYQCSPYHMSSALYPVIAQLERTAGFEPIDDNEARLDKLEAMFSGSNQITALFAALLSLASSRYSPLGVTPQKQKELTLQEIVRRLEHMSRDVPVLLLVEDAHWVDPTTQEALDLQLSALAKLRVLAVVTFRPEYKAPWSDLSHASSLRLSRLGKRYAKLMVEVVGSDLPDELRAEIIAKTDGIPLFVEEMTNAVRKGTSLEGQETRFDICSDVPSLGIPWTLRSSLTARLDQLGQAKELAQVAACIGRQFSRALLAATRLMPDTALDGALSNLVDSGLVYSEDRGEGARFAFKHYLIQQAAYESLLNSTRRKIHAEIAAALMVLQDQSQSSDLIEIARHLLAAQKIRDALPWLRRAAERAASSGSVQESIAILDGAFKLIDDFQYSPRERDRAELELLMAKLPVCIAINGWASDDAAKISGRALDLAVSLGDKAMESSILYEIATMHEVRGEYSNTQEVLARRYRILVQPPEATAVVESGELMACSTFYQGRFDTSIEHANEALRFSNPHEHTVLGATVSEDPIIACLFWLAKSLILQGKIDHARARHQEALDYARRSPNWYAESQADIDSALFSTYQRDCEATLHHAGRAIASSARVGLAYREAVATLIHEWASAETYKAANREKLYSSLRLFRQVGAMIGYGFYLALAAETHARLGELARADELIREALQTCGPSRGFFYESELHRLSGESRLGRPGPQSRLDAEGCYQQALRVARMQGAHLLELRAANSLATLWLDQNQHARARDILTPILCAFSVGFDTRDLLEAKALLQKLG